jgi:hypothetical protein
MNTFKTKLLGAIIIASMLNNVVVAQNHQWTKNFGVAQTTSEFAESRAIAIDPHGNVLTIGTFNGTIDFDPGPGVANLTSTTGELGKDVYISKLNAAGNFIWAKRLGGQNDVNFPNSANGLSITSDLLGNVIVAGNFTQHIDLDPNPVNLISYISTGASDGFILKLNQNGDYQWSQKIGSTNGDFVNGITTDIAGNIFATGSFAGTVDFDGTAGTANATPVGLSDIFVLKLSTHGAFGYVKTFGGTASDVGNAITVDGSGNIYTTGNFAGTSDFDPSAATANLTSNGGGDVFISKLNSSGNYLWAKSFGGTVTTNPDQGNAITTDEQGNVFVAGIFRATNAATAVDFDPGAGVDNKFVVNAYDFFVTKLNAAGNYIASLTAGSTTNDVAYGIAIDAEDNINIVGSISGPIDFDINGLGYVLTPNATDVFVAKYNSAFEFLQADVISSNSINADIAYGIVIDGASNIHLTGVFAGTADFDPSLAGTVNITPVGVRDAFVTKWNQCGNVGGLSTVNKTKTKSAGLLNSATTYASTNCEIIAKVTPSGSNPISGNVDTKVWIQSLQPSATGSMFVKRHYEITPATNASTATGKITLYFTQQEFNDFNAVSPIDLPTNANDILGKANLIVEKRAGVSNNGTGLPNSYTGVIVNIDPLDTDIIWNDGTQRWEVSFNTTGFSGFFVKTETSVLPIQWLNVNGNINKQNLAKINWKVNESNVLRYEIEKSTDGFTFEYLNTVISIGNGENDYSIIDKVKELDVVYYRIKQIDNTGVFSYSSIIKLLPFSSKQIAVYPNPVKNIVTVTLGNKYLNSVAQITDLNGKTIKAFNIISTTFTIDIANFAAGIYLLKIDNGQTQKIIKQ